MARIAEATIWPLRAALPSPIRVSFGEMHHRPGLLLSLKDEDGVNGWGESWINFPAWAPAERTMVLSHLLSEIVGTEIEPKDVPTLYRRYLPQVIQWGGIGPYSQAWSAIECALWDLQAKKHGVPLFKLLQKSGTEISDSVPVYGSGIDTKELQKRIEGALRAGFKDVKIKIGFDTQRDREHFEMATQLAGDGRVMVDANQAWNRHTADVELAFYEDAGVEWVEEPVSALDTDGYKILSGKHQRIAAGENWYVPNAASISDIRLYVLQPDLCKIGGTWAARELIESGPRQHSGVAFHVLGLPISHAFALHVAAAWNDIVTKVEIDTNENPLATSAVSHWKITDGCAVYGGGSGLGVDIDVDKLRSFTIPELLPFCTITA